jgi:hypothetical protein
VTNFRDEQTPPVLPSLRITEALQNTTPVTPLVLPEMRPITVKVAPLVIEPVSKVISEIQPEKPLVKIVSIPNTPNPKTRYLKNGLRTIATFNTNLTAIIFAGSVVTLVLVVLIVRTFLGIISPNTELANETNFTSILSEKGSPEDLALSSASTDALYSALASKPIPANGVQEFVLVNVDGVALQTQEVLSLLNFNTNQNLNQSVTSARFAYSFSKRAIILEVTDATTVFGALLNWEDSMAEDLANTFATGGLSGVTFADKTIGQTDVRVLADDGTPVLVYGFINKNVVVITQDLAAFTAFLPDTP